MPPRWLAQVRYSIAASLLFVLVAGDTLAAPLTGALPTANAVTDRVVGLWLETRSRSALTWQEMLSDVEEGYHESRIRVRSWLDAETDDKTPTPEEAHRPTSGTGASEL